MIITCASDILKENRQRREEKYKHFNPITGEGSTGNRRKVTISDFPLKVQYLPEKMMKVPLVMQLVEAGSVRAFLCNLGAEYTEADAHKVVEAFVRIRIEHDFAFWAAMYVWIKCKGGGDDVLFRLNRAQRKLVERLERRREAGEPIRLILLKARQWGGSTAIQMYMAWLMLVHKVGLNSLIVGLQNVVADEIHDMFRKMIDKYPVRLLYALGEAYNENEPKFVGVGKSGNIHRLPHRNCKIKIGSAERPDSVRGGDYNLVHCSEVGLWKKTDGKSPEDMVRSACSGILLKPYTMIVYESTANGTGNFFQREYDAAKEGRSQFEALFISWFDIEQYEEPLEDREAFAQWLWDNRNNTNAMNEREESGKYLYWLFEIGATLEAINWYIKERSKYADHGAMASEYPSDDVEAFVHSGERVFDKYNVEKLRKGCKPPRYVGDIYADGDEGAQALVNVRFKEDKQGQLWVWSLPDTDQEGERIKNRYLVVVDIGGRGKKADWSVIVVYDRLDQMDGGVPTVVAQWYGHIDMDLLAWKAAQIAQYYDDALLVIESNTLETHDKDRQVDGDMSGYILNQIKDVYDNLYARKQKDEDIREGKPRQYGFHTNVATKPKIISTLVKVIREKLYVERDARCLDEYLCYERKPNGGWGAITGKHDDLLMTRAIGLHISYYEMDLPVIEEKGNILRKKKGVGMATI